MRRNFIIILFGLLNVQLLNAQLNIDSLIQSSDSLVLTNTGFVEKEFVHNIPEFRLAICRDSNFGFYTTSKELILETVNFLSFRPATDILFCGFNYNIQGFINNDIVFDIDYNSDCNYGFIKDYNEHFLTDTLKYFSGLKMYSLFKDVNCSFQSAELLDCYIEAIRSDERTNILELSTNDSTSLFYRLEQKYR